MASARMTGSMQKHPEPTKVGRKRIHPPGYKRQVPSAYIWPKIPEGTIALQDAMGYICGHAEQTERAQNSGIDKNCWIKIIYQIWSARNKGIAGVSFGCSTLAAIGNPLETVGQRKFSSGGM